MVWRSSHSLYSSVKICVWAALLIVLALWAVATLSWPLARDQGDFAWAGSVILKGGVLYKDAWDVKGPFAVFTFAFAQLVFGHNMWGIRVFDLLIELVNFVALAVAALRFWDRTAAQYTAVLGALFASWLNFTISSQRDQWCGCIATVIVAIISARRQLTFRVIAAASFLVGICVLEKPVFAVFILLPAPFLERNSRAVIRFITAAAIGSSVPVVATLVYFGIHHALSDLVNTHLLFNVRAHLKLGGSPAEQVRAFFYSWQAFLPLSGGVPLAVFGAVVLITRNLRFGILYLHIDTHGFAILSRARAALPHVRSILMDEATLLRYRELWVEEPAQCQAATVLGLTPEEQDVFLGLLQNRWGVRVRLEQERIGWDYAWPSVVG